MVEQPRRGEIYWADLDPVVGSEQGGRRPVLVVQNDRGNRRAAVTIVAPLSASLPSKTFPFQVWVGADMLPKRSVVKCDQLRTLDKSRLHPGRLATLGPGLMTQVDDALRLSLGLY